MLQAKRRAKGESGKRRSSSSARPVLRTSLLSLVNVGLMTGFFVLVGLELRRKVHDGMLADLKVMPTP